MDKYINNELLFQIMLKFLETNKLNNAIGVSLSGGVDSMVITFILKQMELMGIIKQVVAVHIYYGNRDDSMDETLFIKEKV